MQVQDVLGAMTVDSQVDIHHLKVDGGMTANPLLMQFQADLLDVQVCSDRIIRVQKEEIIVIGCAELGRVLHEK